MRTAANSSKDWKDIYSCVFYARSQQNFNTTATYNENNGWSMQDDLDLFEICEQLSTRNIRFGMSNVFKCKGKENVHLIEWCEKCGWNVYAFDKFTYMACGKGNSQAKEVFICNY